MNCDSVIATSCATTVSLATNSACLASVAVNCSHSNEHNDRGFADDFSGERVGAVAWRRCDCVLECVVRIERKESFVDLSIVNVASNK
jgi:hypothetical protein